ncbi:MAG: flippase [Flavobacteriales bacterium]
MASIGGGGGKGRREVAKGGGIAFAYRLLGLALTYGLMTLIARRYGADANGYYNLFTAWMAVLSVVATLGLSASNVRSVAEYRAKEEWGKLRPLHNGVLRVVLGMSVLMGAILFGLRLIAPLDGPWSALSSTPVVIMACALPFAALLLVNVEFIRGSKRIAISELLRSPAVLAVAFIGVALMHGGVRSPSVMHAVGFGVCAVISLVVVRRWLGKVEREHQPLHIPVDMREHLTIAVPMIITSLVTTLNGRLDTIMLGWYAVPAVVGIYGTAVKISIATEFVISSMKTIAMPKIAEQFHGGKHDELNDTIHFSSGVIFWLTVPVTIILLVFPEWILSIVGPGFEQGATVLRIMAVAHFVSAASGMVGAFMNMTGNQMVFTRIVVVAVLLNLVLNIYLMPRYGMVGAAWASAVSLALWNISAAVFIKRKHDINMFYWPRMGKRKTVNADNGEQ